MRTVTLIVGLILIAVGCSSSSPATPTPSPRPAATSSDPTRAAAERDCPWKYAADCVPVYLEMAKGTMPAALCVWPDFRWAFVTPAVDTKVGGYGCGTDGGGQVVAIVGRSP